MKTTSSGTVHYIDVDLLPYPDNPSAVGQCSGPGTLALVWHGRVVETFALTPRDVLLVADGDVVAPGTELIAWHYGTLWLRAAIPHGVEAIAVWCEPLDEADDPDTGLKRPIFRGGLDPSRLELRDRGDGAVLAAYDIDRLDRPGVASGAIVRRGDLLVSHSGYRRRDGIRTGIDALRALLDARLLTRERSAVAPCDGVVETAERGVIALRARDGRLLRIRTPTRGYFAVRVGDAVYAGEALTDGERDHRALLHVWGPDRLAAHLLDELETICGPGVPRAYWALAMRAMLGWSRIHDPGDTGLAPGAMVSRDELEEHQRATEARSGAIVTTSPILRGFAAMATALRSPHAAAALTTRTK